MSDSGMMLQNSKAANAGSGLAISAQASQALRAWHAAGLLCSSDNGPVSVVVEVEVCDAMRPSKHLRGSSAKYQEMTRALQDAFLAAPLSFVTEVQVEAGRTGAFEVSLVLNRTGGLPPARVLIHSKLQTSRFPNTHGLISMVVTATTLLDADSMPRVDSRAAREAEASVTLEAGSTGSAAQAMVSAQCQNNKVRLVQRGDEERVRQRSEIVAVQAAAHTGCQRIVKHQADAIPGLSRKNQKRVRAALATALAWHAQEEAAGTSSSAFATLRSLYARHASARPAVQRRLERAQGWERELLKDAWRESEYGVVGGGWDCEALLEGARGRAGSARVHLALCRPEVSLMYMSCVYVLLSVGQRCLSCICLVCMSRVCVDACMYTHTDGTVCKRVRVDLRACTRPHA